MGPASFFLWCWWPLIPTCYHCVWSTSRHMLYHPCPPFYYRPYFHCGYAFCRLPLSQHYTVSISLFTHLCCSLSVFLLQPQPSNSALSRCCPASLCCMEQSLLQMFNHLLLLISNAHFLHIYLILKDIQCPLFKAGLLPVV